METLRKTPLCGVACQKIAASVFAKNNLPEGISCLINGDYTVGELLTKDKRVPLVSATGSTRMGKIVAKTVGERLGKSLLELGGNNAIIVTPDADIKMTVMALFLGLLALPVSVVLQPDDSLFMNLFMIK